MKRLTFHLSSEPAAFAFVLFFTLCWPGGSAASDGSGSGDMAAVQAWINDPSTVAGDIYTMDPGTWSWGGDGDDVDDFLSINKPVWIRGSGRGVTIVEDNKLNSNRYTVAMQTFNDGVTRISDFTLNAGKRNNSSKLPFGIIDVRNASGQDMTVSNAKFAAERIDFDANLRGEIFSVTTAHGVIADCTLKGFSNNDRFVFARGIHYNPKGTGDNGDGSWLNMANNFSGDRFVFVEDCTIDGTGYGNTHICDGWNGMRIVIRGCTAINSGFGNHGAETGSGRSGAVMVVYNNTFMIAEGGNTTHVAGRWRGGTGLVYDNTYTGYSPGRSYSLTPYRAMGPSLGNWGEADGTNPWDNNDDANNPYDTGIADSGSGPQLLVDTDKAWKTDQWIGYTVNRLSGPGYGDQMNVGYIKSNDATSLTLASGKNSGGGSTQINLQKGDVYEINLVLEILDQPGVTGGSPYIDTNPRSVRENGPPGPWDQIDAPIYAWGNVRSENGESVLLSNSGFRMVRDGEHFHNCESLEDARSKGLDYTEFPYPHPLRTSEKGLRPSPPTALRTTP